MRLGVDIKEPSTLRGLVWGLTAFIGLMGWLAGKDITPVILIGTAVAGGLGIGVRDE